MKITHEACVRVRVVVCRNALRDACDRNASLARFTRFLSVRANRVSWYFSGDVSHSFTIRDSMYFYLSVRNFSPHEKDSVFRRTPLHSPFTTRLDVRGVSAEIEQNHVVDRISRLFVKRRKNVSRRPRGAYIDVSTNRNTWKRQRTRDSPRSCVSALRSARDLGRRRCA